MGLLWFEADVRLGIPLCWVRRSPAILHSPVVFKGSSAHKVDSFLLLVGGQHSGPPCLPPVRTPTSTGGAGALLRGGGLDPLTWS